MVPKKEKSKPKTKTKTTTPVVKTKAVASNDGLPTIFKGKFVETVGRRKTSIARVRFFADAVKDPKDSVLYINMATVESYFKGDLYSQIANSPLKKANIAHYAISCKVAGGGMKGQAEAVRLGISRALIIIHSGLRKELKDVGFLMRDPRMKERRKFGLKKARRAAQWSKR